MSTAAGVMPIYENEQGYMDTWGVGGDRFSFLPASMFAPDPFIGTTTLVPEALLSAPPSWATLGSASSQYGAQGAASRNAAQAPWSPSQSLLPWVLLGLIVGFLGMHYLYFRKHGKR